MPSVADLVALRVPVGLGCPEVAADFGVVPAGLTVDFEVLVFAVESAVVLREVDGLVVLAFVADVLAFVVAAFVCVVLAVLPVVLFDGVVAVGSS